MAVNHKVGSSSPPWNEFEQIVMVVMVKLQCPPIKYHPYSPYQMLPSKAMYGVSLGCVSMDHVAGIEATSIDRLRGRT